MLQIRWFIFFWFFLWWLISFFGKEQATESNTPTLGVSSTEVARQWKRNNRRTYCQVTSSARCFVPFSVHFTFSNYESLNVPFGSILAITLLKFSEDIRPHYSSHPPPDRVSLSMCQHQALSGWNVKKVHSFFHHLQCLWGASHSKCPLNWNEPNTSHYSES